MTEAAISVAPPQNREAKRKDAETPVANAPNEELATGLTGSAKHNSTKDENSSNKTVQPCR